VSLKQLHMAMNGGVADEDETLQDLGEDKTSKEADKVSKETGLASEEARKGGGERIKEKEKKRGDRLPPPWLPKKSLENLEREESV
jgi:hypothetical protein